MKSKTKWQPFLVIGFVLLLASSMMACGQPTSSSSPTIAFTPASLSFAAKEGGANPPSQTLTIWNSGGGTLSWSLSKSASWLALSPTSGVSAGEAGSITVSVDISEMDKNNYSGTIMISALGASNSPQTIAVNLTVRADVYGMDDETR